VGRRYAALFALANLVNVSDKSAVARLDVSRTFLTHLRLEVFTAVHYGAAGGEFRLGFTVPPGTLAGQPFPGVRIPGPAVDAGLALRVSL
jgi:hypothetical protein